MYRTPVLSPAPLPRVHHPERGWALVLEVNAEGAAWLVFLDGPPGCAGRYVIEPEWQIERVCRLVSMYREAVQRWTIDGEPIVGSIRDFCRDNIPEPDAGFDGDHERLDGSMVWLECWAGVDDAVRKLAAFEPGEALLFGGGACATGELRRVS